MVAVDVLFLTFVADVVVEVVEAVVAIAVVQVLSSVNGEATGQGQRQGVGALTVEEEAFAC